MKNTLIISAVAVIVSVFAGSAYADLGDSWRPYREPEYTSKQSKGEYVLVGCVDADPKWNQTREQLKPVLMEYMSKNNNITPYKVSCKQQAGLCAKHHVSQEPTIILFKGKKEQGRLTGAQCNAAAFRQLLNKTN